MLKQEWTTQQLQDEPIDHLDQSSIGHHEINGGDGDGILRFRRFCVLPRARQLLADGRPIELGSRALDLLIVLLRSPGAIVTKSEIVNRVWPSTLVAESNLRVQMAALRRALGRDRDVIKTVPGRGYLFAAEVVTGSVVDTSMSTTSTGSRSTVSREEIRPTVIDNDRDGYEALHGFLRSAGLRVEFFASVQEFLDKAGAARAGSLVLDAWLPGRSALDFPDDFVRTKLHLPVMFVSGHADSAVPVRAIKRRASESLTTPVRHNESLSAAQLAIGSIAAGCDDRPTAL